MDDNRPEYLARLPDGKLIKIYPDKFHYRAYNAPGVMVGEPFVQIGDLLKSLGATIVSAEGGGSAGDWLHPEAKSDEQLAHEKKAAARIEMNKIMSDYGTEHIPDELQAHFDELSEIAGDDEDEEIAGGRDKSVKEMPQEEKTVNAVQGSFTDVEAQVDGSMDDIVPVPADKWSRDKCGQWEEEICKMDMEKCDRQCGQHASRASLAAQPTNALPPLTGGEPVRDEDKNASKTPGQPAE